MNGTSDIIIVGAGVAGSALAHALGKDGRSVRVIERDLTMPNRMVGELLQPGGYLKLLELGLEDCLTEIDAQQIFGYVLFNEGKHVKLSYPLNNFHSNVTGKSFHNGRFVQKLREKAASLPNVKLEQGTVTSLVKDDKKGSVKGVKYKTKAGQDMIAYATLTVVCDGCFSNLRRFLCSFKVKVNSQFVGWVLENCQLPFANYGHVIIAEPSPILFYPISCTETRCFVNLPCEKVPPLSTAELSNFLKAMVAPQVPPELYDAFVSTIDRAKIRRVPYLSMSAVAQHTPGALLIGDAFNMRHPFSGGGMTVALSDVVILRDLLRPLHSLNDTSSLCKHLKSFYTLRKPMAITINTIAATLQWLFCTTYNEAVHEVIEASFGYLKLGGVFATEPMTLLSGINPSLSRMLLLFLSVAVYSIGRLLLPFPSPKRMLLGYQMIQNAIRIIFAAIKAEGASQGNVLQQKI